MRKESSKYKLIFAVLAAGLTIMDVAGTIIVTEGNPKYELNPLVRNVWNFCGIEGFVAFKLLTCTVAIAAVVRYNKSAVYAKVGSVLVLLVYGITWLRIF